MIRWWLLKYMTVFSLVLGSGAMLVHVSNHVQYVERDLRALNREIASEQEALRVLQAEWAYLNNPTRLEDLARRYTGLVAPSSGQVLSQNPFVDSNDQTLENSEQIGDSRTSSSSVLRQNISFQSSSSRSAASVVPSSMIHNANYNSPSKLVRSAHDSEVRR